MKKTKQELDVLKNLGDVYLRKAWERGAMGAWHVTDAQAIAVGDLVRLSLDMKAALEDIGAKATFELDHPTDLERTCLSIIKKRANEVLK